MVDAHELIYARNGMHSEAAQEMMRYLENLKIDDDQRKQLLALLESPDR